MGNRNRSFAIIAVGLELHAGPGFRASEAEERGLIGITQRRKKSTSIVDMTAVAGEHVVEEPTRVQRGLSEWSSGLQRIASARPALAENLGDR